ncbi:MAG: 23S rRNA (uracil(1939)-C(5))-methyltransferase RlmD [Firmicutes bacterium]|jgi:23S rRNA (uracil1939-C5)-methyltransferase|uniref:23S rRNA (Uracil(1939)-C(5))-methyltransferase RlmD n=1 Tax=Sulfobacillus benefaciens TaxID=453960 RepID=A0A2T2WYA4_9FIRM|nr:23S rRNA (uracil(1939)-C(5))-methyltransferase RlmD [Bacillota bacterium]MCL5015259.1 23S rRNA (uracil(1939)-C(5))-methyltransferase RlmD [Bacillota bacterium]PSR27219.1 MAG: 23S rRNA (uracil(1939)-C(5))-methyltransferase RlmD [Sulfobacillus benefaciens]HBQ93742.1 23S rRNA (uracil(1939)-C(5))-methyltransferase RlmD [Sulfobacillus sp.]
MNQRDALAIEVKIERMGQNGQGVAYLPDGRIFFVDKTLPGETVQARIDEVKSRYARGTLEKVIVPSPERIDSACPDFEQCGGCAFQHWDYEAELRYKENRVRESLRRIGKFTNAPVHSIIGAPSMSHYRNKGQFPWGHQRNRPILGLYQSRSHQLVELTGCLIQDPSISQMLQDLPELVKHYGLSVYDEGTGQGTLRHTLFRTSKWSSDMLVLFVVTSKDPRLTQAAQDLLQHHPKIRGVGVNVNTSRTNRILGDKTELLAGSPIITDRILGMSFHVSFESFFQVNPEQVGTLYRTALGYLPEHAHSVWDLYAGVGTLASLISPFADSVYAIEANRQATRDATQNLALNRITNTHIISATVEDAVTQGLLPRPQVVVMDPPRKGVDTGVLNTLMQWAPHRIIYVSCNPDTLARDAEILHAEYDVKSITPIDMFPRTDHVESVSLFVRKDVAP